MSDALPLRGRLLTAVQDKSHRAVTFTDLDQVPVGSTGYLSPGGRQVYRDEKGWLHDGRRFDITENEHYVFTSHTGPANDAKLVELLEQALVPAHHLLVSFEAVTDYESGDWEHSQPGYHYTTLAHPEVLEHDLDEGELARLYFEIEAVGSLGESDGYSHLDKTIAALGEPAAIAAREAAASDANHDLTFTLKDHSPSD